jgi:Spy/CpxP family protein refolding chaperone
MGVGHVVLIAALTFFALGALRRMFWFARWRRHGGWHHGHGFRRGGLRWISRAIDATPEQEAKLAEIATRMQGDFQSMRETRAGVIDALVEILPGEALNEQALDQLASKATATYEKVRGDLVQSIVELHRTLTPAQRRQVTAWLQRRRSYSV